MKTLEDQMAFYAAYHQDGRNKLSHFIGVPAIVLGVMVALAWLRMEVGGTTVSGAMVITAVVLVYYLLLDIPLGIAMVAVFGALLYAAEIIAALPLKGGRRVVSAAFRRWLGRPADRARVRRPQARAGRQPVPDFRCADLPVCGNLLCARVQTEIACSGAGTRAANARRRRRRATYAGVVSSRS